MDDSARSISVVGRIALKNQTHRRFMRTRDIDILIVPGLGGSGPDHWQSRWEGKLPTARRVQQADWDRPNRVLWVSRVAEAVAEATRPVVLVAHSLGVVAAAEALEVGGASRVSGAFLVAPPEEARVAEIPEIDPAFLPYPRSALPCPSVLVASSDDPYATIGAARTIASQWGSTLLEAGAAGHINSASGHGPWPEGLMAFAGFISRLQDPQTAP